MTCKKRKKMDPKITFSICAICIWVIPLLSAGNIPGGGQQNDRYHREKRSPQFSFTGRNVLSDLAQQIKPPSLSDLDDFRQKMANLANFTALMEQALAAEKAARTSLQSFVENIREQVTGIQTAVNPDPENYWTESKECGGILVSQTGKITYKANDYYENHERCIWTVRANHRSKIRVSLSSSGLEEVHDFISVTELVEGEGIQWATKRMQAGETKIFNGPLILIAFISDGSIRKKGFQVEFEGLGTNVKTKTIYQHFHLTDWMGQFDSTNISKSLEEKGIKLRENQELFATAVVNPLYWNYSRLQFSVDENELDLRPEECEKTDLSILNDFPSREGGQSKRCCGSKCDKSKFESSFSRTILAILKSSDLSDGSQFEFNWSSDINVPGVVSEDICGGLLTSNYGTISYKLEKSYENNERCVWVVTPEKIMGEMEFKFILLKEGFEHRYDYVTLSYFSKSENDIDYDFENGLKTIFLYKASLPISIQAPFVVIEFYSDAANLGKTTGFELTWEAKERSDSSADIEIEFSQKKNGRIELSCPQHQTSPNITDGTLHKYFINAPNPSKAEDERLHLLLETDAEDTKIMTVFTSERGNFSRADGSGKYESVDGIFILKSTCRHQDGEEAGQVPKISWKTEVSDAASPGGKEKVTVKSVDQCGEVLYGDSGKISYKLGKEYDSNERCTWIIRAKSASTISVRLMADGLESCCDGIQINRIDTKLGLIDPNTISLNREDRFQTVEGPVLLVTFLSDHSVEGTGFSIEFETKGAPIPTIEDVAVQHWNALVKDLPNQEEPIAPVFIQLAENTITIDLFHFENRNETSALVIMDNLETNECGKDSVTLYHMREYKTFELLKQHPDNTLCPLGAPLTDVVESTVVFQRENIEFKGLLLVIAKIKEVSNDKSLSLSFQ